MVHIPGHVGRPLLFGQRPKETPDRLLVESEGKPIDQVLTDLLTQSRTGALVIGLQVGSQGFQLLVPQLGFWGQTQDGKREHQAHSPDDNRYETAGSAHDRQRDPVTMIPPATSDERPAIRLLGAS